MSRKKIDKFYLENLKHKLKQYPFSLETCKVLLSLREWLNFEISHHSIRHRHFFRILPYRKWVLDGILRCVFSESILLVLYANFKSAIPCHTLLLTWDRDIHTTTKTQ